MVGKKIHASNRPKRNICFAINQSLLSATITRFRMVCFAECAHDLYRTHWPSGFGLNLSTCVVTAIAICVSLNPSFIFFNEVFVTHSHCLVSCMQLPSGHVAKFQLRKAEPHCFAIASCAFYQIFGGVQM